MLPSLVNKDVYIGLLSVCRSWKRTRTDHASCYIDFCRPRSLRTSSRTNLFWRRAIGRWLSTSATSSALLQSRRPVHRCRWRCLHGFSAILCLSNSLCRDW